MHIEVLLGMSWSDRIPLKKLSTAKVVKLSNWIPSKRFSIPISLMVPIE